MFFIRMARMKALLHGSDRCSKLNQLPDGAVELTVHPGKGGSAENPDRNAQADPCRSCGGKFHRESSRKKVEKCRFLTILA